MFLKLQQNIGPRPNPFVLFYFSLILFYFEFYSKISLTFVESKNGQINSIQHFELSETVSTHHEMFNNLFKSKKLNLTVLVLFKWRNGILIIRRIIAFFMKISLWNLATQRTFLIYCSKKKSWTCYLNFEFDSVLD